MRDKKDGSGQEPMDWLAQWAIDIDQSFFLKPDATVIDAHRIVVDWVYKRRGRYKRSSLNRFYNGADPRLIAQALAHQDIVVTQEVKVPRDAKKVKVPNVCEGLGVRCVNSFKVLDKEGAQFILAPTYPVDPPTDRIN